MQVLSKAAEVIMSFQVKGEFVYVYSNNIAKFFIPIALSLTQIVLLTTGTIWPSGLDGLS